VAAGVEPEVESEIVLRRVWCVRVRAEIEGFGGEGFGGVDVCEGEGGGAGIGVGIVWVCGGFVEDVLGL
jgi:hypothetical protein